MSIIHKEYNTTEEVSLLLNNRTVHYYSPFWGRPQSRAWINYGAGKSYKYSRGGRYTVGATYNILYHADGYHNHEGYNFNNCLGMTEDTYIIGNEFWRGPRAQGDYQMGWYTNSNMATKQAITWENIVFENWMGTVGAYYTNGGSQTELWYVYAGKYMWMRFVNCKFININNMRRTHADYGGNTSKTGANPGYVDISYDHCLFVNSKFNIPPYCMNNCTVINTKFGQDGSQVYRTGSYGKSGRSGIFNSFIDEDSILLYTTNNYNGMFGFSIMDHNRDGGFEISNTLIKGRFVVCRKSSMSSVGRTETNQYNERFSASTYYRIWDFRASNASRADDYNDFLTGTSKHFSNIVDDASRDMRGYTYFKDEVYTTYGRKNKGWDLLPYTIGDNDAGNGQDLTKLFNLIDNNKREYSGVKYRTFLQDGFDDWSGTPNAAFGNDPTRDWATGLTLNTLYYKPTIDYSLKEGSPLAHIGAGGSYIGYRGISNKLLSSDATLFPTLVGMERSSGSFKFEDDATTGYVESKIVCMGGGTPIKISQHENRVMQTNKAFTFNKSQGPGAEIYGVATHPQYHSHSNNSSSIWMNSMPRPKGYCTAWNPEQLLTNPRFIEGGAGWTISTGANSVDANTGDTRGFRFSDHSKGLMGGGCHWGAKVPASGWDSYYIRQTGVFDAQKQYVILYHEDTTGTHKSYGLGWAQANINNCSYASRQNYRNYSDVFPMDIKINVISGQTDMQIDQYHVNHSHSISFCEAYKLEDIYGGRFSFYMKYGNTSAACNSASYKKFLFGTKLTIDGSNRGNGDVDYDPLTAAIITPKFVKFKFTFYKDHPMAYSKGLYNMIEK